MAKATINFPVDRKNWGTTSGYVPYKTQFGWVDAELVILNSDNKWVFNRDQEPVDSQHHIYATKDEAIAAFKE